MNCAACIHSPIAGLGLPNRPLRPPVRSLDYQRTIIACHGCDESVAHRALLTGEPLSHSRDHCRKTPARSTGSTVPCSTSDFRCSNGSQRTRIIPSAVSFRRAALLSMAPKFGKSNTFKSAFVTPRPFSATSNHCSHPFHESRPAPPTQTPPESSRVGGATARQAFPGFH